MTQGSASADRIVAAHGVAELLHRPAKINEILAPAWALGCPASKLMEYSGVRDRLECVGHATDSSSMETMRRELIHYLELDAYLEDQGISPQR